MQKVNFKTSIKIVNICLGALVVINFSYFAFIFVKILKDKQSISSSQNENTEFEKLITEFEKNIDKIKNLVK